MNYLQGNGDRGIGHGGMVGRVVGGDKSPCGKRRVDALVGTWVDVIGTDLGRVGLSLSEPTRRAPPTRLSASTIAVMILKRGRTAGVLWYRKICPLPSLAHAPLISQQQGLYSEQKVLTHIPRVFHELSHVMWGG